MSSENQVPLPALERLATYIRCLMQLENDGVWTVSSQEMESLSGVKAVLSAQAGGSTSAVFDALLAAANRHGHSVDDLSLLLVRRR